MMKNEYKFYTVYARSEWVLRDDTNLYALSTSFARWYEFMRAQNELSRWNEFLWTLINWYVFK